MVMRNLDILIRSICSLLFSFTFWTVSDVLFAESSLVISEVKTFKTSSFIILPSLPVPNKVCSLISFSFISFLAEGAFSISLIFLSFFGAIFFTDFSVFVFTNSPSLTIPRIASSPTVSPSLAIISDNVPETVDGTSTVTLSVSSSHNISSIATVSPGLLNQVATVASVTLSPRVGTFISVIFYLN